MSALESINDEIISKILKKDKGGYFSVHSWKVIDFLKEGDNYVGYVTSIEVNYKDDNKDETTTYIAKCNPTKEHSQDLNSIMLLVFKHEIDFLQDIAPKLSTFLVDQSPISVPECLYSSMEKTKEFFITRDLRIDGYKMFNKTNTIDLSNLLLVIHEIAKIHATGYVLIQKNSPEMVIKMYPNLAEGCYTRLTKLGDSIAQAIESHMDLALKLLKNTSEYENVVSWIKSNKVNVLKIMTENLDPQNDKFYTIIHGDCWTNNFLFK